jgi:hypothetical protein
MKSVSVSLPGGWETERWKLIRRFPDCTDACLDDGSRSVSLSLKSSDSRLAQDAHYGFPTDGIRLTFVISQDYISLPALAGIRLTEVESSRAPLPAVCRFGQKLKDLFARLLTESGDFCLFMTLKSLDRFLTDLWISSILECIDEPMTNEMKVGELTGSLGFDSTLRNLVVKVVGKVVCSRCLEKSADVHFGPNRPTQFTCQRCEEPLSVLLSDGLKIFSSRCVVREVTNVSVWFYCPCGNDCYFHEMSLNSKPYGISFFCDCAADIVRFSYECLCDVSSYVRSSPKVRPESRESRKFKEGVALPINGACKHYKKSFRWLQYSCCKEWFACNQCHDSRSGNHERGPSPDLMMCGFCSKQQPVNHACISCGKETTPGWTADEKVTTDRNRKPPYWKKRR